MTKGKTLVIKKDDSNVDSLISQAITANVPVETMEKLFALREKVKAEKAKEEFVQSLSTFQSECPIIEKTKVVFNKDGKTERYRFAPIDSIVAQIKKPLSKSNLSYTWTVKNEKDRVTAICKVTHILGYSEESSFEIPIDPEGYMTAPQKVASALTFAKRYSLCNALGISTGDEDTDATDVKKDKDVKSVKSKIMFLLKGMGEKIGNKSEVESAITKLTGMEPNDENFDEILSRLQIINEERNENTEV